MRFIPTRHYPSQVCLLLPPSIQPYYSILSSGSLSEHSASLGHSALAGPSPYHGEAWRSLKVVDPGQKVSVDRTPSAGVGVVAALLCCTWCPRQFET
jgi:hypothetical protein